jgi:outer membrane protein assembly factor BamB
MRKSFRVAIFSGMFLLVVFSSPALEIIVDNSDTSCTVVGDWATSTTTCYGPNKFTHSQGVGSNTVTWTFSVPPGWYRVDFRMNSNSTYATDAHYSIIHRDGTANLVVDQQRGSSTWYILGGAYYCDGVSTVTLTDQYTNGTHVIADAIRYRSIFSFVQMSDSHVGYGRGTSNTTAVANELKTLGKVTMASYGFDAPPPSFAIHSGDCTEYGQEYWNTLISIFSGMPFPVYLVPGNHDYTQNCVREKIRARHGNVCYTFDFTDRGTRHHFVCLNSPIIQSPRASFCREELDWLESDLAALEPNTRVFLNFHHPINGASDPKPYDTYRLLETIRPFNAIIAFYGHGHNFTQSIFDGLRIVQGGSTYNDTTNVGGYNIITVTHDRIHIAKKICGEATAATGILNNMAIPAAPAYPTITVTSPVKDSIQTSSAVAVSASISGASGTVSAVDVELDGDATWRSMTDSGGGVYTTSINLTGAVHGRHWVRVRFTTVSPTGTYYKMVPFWHWDAFPRAKWVVDLGASSLSMPAIFEGKVYVGTNGGQFRCVSAWDGSDVWDVTLPSDVTSAPAIANGRVVFGCGDGKVYCLHAGTGATIWAKTCTGPVYAPPTIDGSTVYIGTIGTGASNSAYLYSLSLSNGAENWKYAAANAIETKPFVLDGTVFFGAWDCYFYAINTSTGARTWRYLRNSSRYYSPADSWPVASASANRVFVADREYYLSAINITSGAQDWYRTSISSQALTPDGLGLLQRVTSGNLDRTTFSNGNVWSRACSLDSAPVAPQCNSQSAVVVDQDGRASIVNLSTGALEFQFQVAQGYQLHPVNIDANGNVYASTYDGFLLAITNNPTGVDDWMNY